MFIKIFIRDLLETGQSLPMCQLLSQLSELLE